MFGGGVDYENQVKTPEWADELMGLYCPSVRLVWCWYPKAKSTYIRGCAYTKLGVIEIHGCTEKSDESVWVLLHEISHFLAPSKRNPGRQNRVVHHEEFFRTASRLYQKHNVLDYAMKHEYKTGIKFLRETVAQA